MADTIDTTMFRANILSISPYVPGKPIEEVKREFGLDDVIKLASNENPLGPSPMAIKAIQEIAALTHIYPDGSCYELKKVLSDKLVIDPKCLIMGNGSDEIIQMIAECFLHEQEEVVYATPSFVEYEFATLLMGGKCVSVPLRNHIHDLTAMKEAVTDRTKLIFICNPNNPTGTIVRHDEVTKFMQSIPGNVIVVFDEAYMEYVTDPEYPDCMKFVREGRNVIVMRTFSKAYGLAGLRIGYAIARPEVIDLLNRVKQPFNVNLIAQSAAIAALADQEHLTRSLETNLQGKRFLETQFEQLGLEYIPAHGNFIMVNIGIDSKTCFTGLLKLGVIVRTGDIFGMPTWLRVTIGSNAENARFVTALRTVLGR